MRPPKMHCVIPHFSLPASARTSVLPIISHAKRPAYPIEYRQTQCRLLHHSSYQASPGTYLATTEHLTHHFPATSKLRLQTSSLRTQSFSTSTRTMSDDAYMAFLDKANADVSGQAPQGTDTVKTETVHSSLSVPKPLQSVNTNYVSETDEPFEPVALKWDGAAKGAWPSPGMPCPSSCFLHIPLHACALEPKKKPR